MTDIFQHPIYMWHPRWRLNPARDLSQGCQVPNKNDQGTPLLNSSEQSAEIIKRTKALLGSYHSTARQPREQKLISTAAEARMKKLKKQVLHVLAAAHSLSDQDDASTIQDKNEDMSPLLRKVRNRSSIFA
jgi:hypothetical protein